MEGDEFLQGSGGELLPQNGGLGTQAAHPHIMKYMANPSHTWRRYGIKAIVLSYCPILLFLFVLITAVSSIELFSRDMLSR